MQPDHLHAVMKDFEHIEADSTNGGYDKIYFRHLVAGEHVFANANITTATGPQRSVWAWNFDALDLEQRDGNDPSFDLRTANSIVLNAPSTQIDPSEGELPR